MTDEQIEVVFRTNDIMLPPVGNPFREKFLTAIREVAEELKNETTQPAE